MYTVLERCSQGFLAAARYGDVAQLTEALKVENVFCLVLYRPGCSVTES